MKSKTVYQTDNEGVYVGETTADESPLEPGVFLIPAGGVEFAPPAFDSTRQLARFSHGKWTVENIPVIEPEEEPAPTYQQELAELNAAWQQQVDGYNRAFAVAALSDGPHEESKKLAIRADYEAARQKNAEDRAALKTKYGM